MLLFKLNTTFLREIDFVKARKKKLADELMGHREWLEKFNAVYAQFWE